MIFHLEKLTRDNKMITLQSFFNFKSKSSDKNERLHNAPSEIQSVMKNFEVLIEN